MAALLHGSSSSNDPAPLDDFDEFLESVTPGKTPSKMEITDDSAETPVTPRRVSFGSVMVRSGVDRSPGKTPRTPKLKSILAKRRRILQSPTSTPPQASAARHDKNIKKLIAKYVQHSLAVSQYRLKEAAKREAKETQDESMAQAEIDALKEQVDDLRKQLEQGQQGRPAISPRTREMVEQAKAAVDAATLQRQRVESLCTEIENEAKDNKRRLNNVEVELAATKRITPQIAQVETRLAGVEAMMGQEHQTGENLVNMEKRLAALENTGTVELHIRRNIEVRVETIEAERKQDGQQSALSEITMELTDVQRQLTEMRAKQAMAPLDAYVSRVQKLETNLTQARMEMLTKESAIIRKIEAETPAIQETLGQIRQLGQRQVDEMASKVDRGEHTTKMKMTEDWMMQAEQHDRQRRAEVNVSIVQIEEWLQQVDRKLHMAPKDPETPPPPPRRDSEGPRVEEIHNLLTRAREAQGEARIAAESAETSNREAKIAHRDVQEVQREVQDSAEATRACRDAIEGVHAEIQKGIERQRKINTSAQDAAKSMQEMHVKALENMAQECMVSIEVDCRMRIGDLSVHGDRVVDKSANEMQNKLETTATELEKRLRVSGQEEYDRLHLQGQHLLRENQQQLQEEVAKIMTMTPKPPPPPGLGSSSPGNTDAHDRVTKKLEKLEKDVQVMSAEYDSKYVTLSRTMEIGDRSAKELMEKETKSMAEKLEQYPSPEKFNQVVMSNHQMKTDLEEVIKMLERRTPEWDGESAERKKDIDRLLDHIQEVRSHPPPR